MSNIGPKLADIDRARRLAVEVAGPFNRLIVYLANHSCPVDLSDPRFACIAKARDQAILLALETAFPDIAAELK